MTNPTACIVVIGNEVLSGRTQDANIRFLAQRLGDMGIPVREVRVIPDLEETIVRTAFDYCEKNQVQTARLLDISRNVLRHKLGFYGMLSTVRRL